MIVFHTTAPVTLSTGGGGTLTLFPPRQDREAESIPLDALYVTTRGHIPVLERRLKAEGARRARLHAVGDDSQFRSLEGFPVMLGGDNAGDHQRLVERVQRWSPARADLARQITALPAETRPRLVILNGFGTGVGDTVVGLTALRAVMAILHRRFVGVAIELWLRPDVMDRLHPVLRHESLVSGVRPLPQPLSEMMAFDGAWDLSGLVTRIHHTEHSLLDSCLIALGVDPETVATEHKRNLWPQDERATRTVAPVLDLIRSTPDDDSRDLPLVLFHPEASTPLRSVPEAQRAPLARALADTLPCRVITAAPLEARHPRVHDLSGFSPDLDHLTALIAGCDGLVTVDTALYHLADAVDTPAVALFSTIDPERRVGHYPYVAGLLLPDARESGHFGRDLGNADDARTLGPLWQRLDMAEVGRRLAECQRARANRPHVPCPVCAARVPDRAITRDGDWRLVACPTCEAEFALPRPVRPAPAPPFPPLSATAEAARAAVRRQPRFRRLLALLKPLAPGRALVAGCGPGALVAELAALGFSAQGLDRDASAIARGQALFPHLTLEVEDADAELAPMDLVVTDTLLSTVPDPVALADSLAQRLRPGGLWALITPNRDRLPYHCGMVNARRHPGLGHGEAPPTFVTRFRAASHRALLARSGRWTVVTQTTTPVVAATARAILGTEPRDENLDPLLSGLTGQGNFLITLARRMAED